MISVKYQVLFLQILVTFSIPSETHSLWIKNKFQNLSNIHFPLRHENYNPNNYDVRNKDRNIKAPLQAHPLKLCNPRAPCGPQYKSFPTDNRVDNGNKYGNKELGRRRVCCMMFGCCMEDILPIQNTSSRPIITTPCRPTRCPPTKTTCTTTTVCETTEPTRTKECTEETPPSTPDECKTTTDDCIQSTTCPPECNKPGGCNVYHFEQNLIYFILMANMKDNCNATITTLITPKYTTETTTKPSASVTPETTTETTTKGTTATDDDEGIYLTDPPMLRAKDVDAIMDDSNEEKLKADDQSGNDSNSKSDGETSDSEGRGK